MKHKLFSFSRLEVEPKNEVYMIEPGSEAFYYSINSASYLLVELLYSYIGGSEYVHLYEQKRNMCNKYYINQAYQCSSTV